jgi:hypothetical protein
MIYRSRIADLKGCSEETRCFYAKWIAIVGDFLSESDERKLEGKRLVKQCEGYVMTCCEYQKFKSQRREANSATRAFAKDIHIKQTNGYGPASQKKLNKKLSKQDLGGTMYFDTNIGIKADPKFCMTHMLGRQSGVSHWAGGRGHGVISQLVANDYAMRGVVSLDGSIASVSTTIEALRVLKEFTLYCPVTCKESKWKVLIIVLKDFTPLPVQRGTEKLPDEMIQNMVVYFPSFFDCCEAKGVDAVAFISPPVGAAKDGDALAVVYLHPCFTNAMLNDKKKESKLWNYLTQQVGKVKQIEVSRTGGSNGNPSPFTAASYILMNLYNKAPRQSRAVAYTFGKTLVHVAYISPYNKRHRLVHFNYSNPRPATVLNGIEDLSVVSNDGRKALVAFLHAKAFTVPILRSLSACMLEMPLQLGKVFEVSTEACGIQAIANLFAGNYAKSKALPGSEDFKFHFCQFLAQSCCFTVMAYAAGYHYDKIGQNIFRSPSIAEMRPQTKRLFDKMLPSARQLGMSEDDLFQVFRALSRVDAFVENKMLLRMHCATALHPSRGGCGSKQAVGAVLDHNIYQYRDTGQNWGEQEMRAFIREARRIRREEREGENNQRILEAFAV